MIVPCSAGGVADTIARIIQPKVAENLGQSFIIENRTGASGSIGAMAVAPSPADGHTFLFEGASFATLPLVSRSLVAAIYHALKDPAIQARLEATGADPVISSPVAY
jgi:tripartite-type tricarboxylate transporter receptor subunit TctC